MIVPTFRSGSQQWRLQWSELSFPAFLLLQSQSLPRLRLLKSPSGEGVSFLQLSDPDVFYVDHFMEMYRQMLMYVLLWPIDTMPFHAVDMVRIFGGSSCRLMYDAVYVTYHSWLNEDYVLFLWVWMYVRLWTFLDARILWSLTPDVFIAHFFFHLYYALPNCLLEC